MTGEINIEGVLHDLKTRVQSEGVNTKQQYAPLIDEKIDELLEWGQLNDDADTEGLRANLLGRWDDVRNSG